MKTAAFTAGKTTYHADTCRELTDAVRRGTVRLEACARGTYPGARLPARATPGLLSVGFWDAGHDQDWGLPVHRNEGIEFMYMARGGTGFAVDGVSRLLRPGDLTVTRPWQPHRVGLPQVRAGLLYWVILDVGVRRPHQPWAWPDWIVLSRGDLAELTRLLRRTERPVWRAPALAARFEALGADVLSRDAEGSRASRLAVDINSLLIGILDLLRHVPAKDEPGLSSAERTVEMVLAEVEQSAAEPWTLDRMAESAGLHRTRFAYYVRRLRNRTPIEVLAEARVALARRMIRERPDLPLTELAFECGFSSSQYFATVFRRVTGHAPRAEVCIGRRAKV